MRSETNFIDRGDKRREVSVGADGVSNVAKGVAPQSFWRLFASSKRMLALSLVVGALAGAGNATLMMLINRSLHLDRREATFAVAFFGVCAFVLASSSLSMTLLSRLAESNLYNLRMRLSRHILSAPFETLQALGPHRLMAALTDDIGAAVEALDALPTLFIASATLVTVLCYLDFLAPQLLLLVLSFLLLGVLGFRLLQGRAMRWLRLAREADNMLFRHFCAITDGFKELKMDVRRRRAFLDDEMRRAAETFRERRNEARLVYVFANRWGQSLYFVLIGVILLVLPHYAEISRETSTGFTLAILFLGGPISTILDAVPAIGMGVTALRNIETLGLGRSAERDASTAAVAERPSTLELVAIRHRYPGTAGEGHQVGPLNLKLQPGELVFLTGGNGSGKTTMALIMLGLLTPDAGEIKLAGRPVARDDIDSYRQNFASVFADAHVFDRLLGYSSEEALTKAEELLFTLRLDRQVKIEGGRFSTVDLSRGQRKRLALLSAYLTDRPFFLFDEWAAEQDPDFRDYFYETMLPELKARGKTIIVITHDDRYFHLSDRLLRMRNGQLEDIRPALAASA